MNRPNMRRAPGHRLLPRVEHAFLTLYRRFQEARPGIPVSLGVDDNGAGDCARCFAYCLGNVIAVARKLEREPREVICGVLMHEFGHAALGDDEHTERDADDEAESIFGMLVFYDERGVQTTKSGRRPRPQPRHLGRGTRTNPDTRTMLYHLTDKTRFRLDPKKVPEDAAVAIYERTEPGLFLADKDGVERWLNEYGYWRPFVVEFEVPEEAVRRERWGGEFFLPGRNFAQVEVRRVLPLDAFAREVYGGYGWTEEFFKTTFDTEEPISKDKLHGYPFHGWRFEDDVRAMSADWLKSYKRRVRAYAKETRRAYT